MYDSSYLKKTGQLWKLGVLTGSSTLGLALLWLGQSRLGHPASSGLRLMLAGLGIGFGGGAWAAWAIECPACKEKLLWHAMARQSSGFWLHWLVGLTSCPCCRATAEGKVERPSLTPSQPSLGLEAGAVRLVEYDARWPALFAAEEQRIRGEWGTLALRLEHIGGTAIPGMCAKPVLDMAAGRPREASTADYVAALEGAGYEHRGEQGVPGREFFCRGQPRAYHVHLVEEGGPLWRDYLAFRDYLRAHADAARRFAGLKRALAARFPRDREAYTNAKSSHVEEILRLREEPT